MTKVELIQASVNSHTGTSIFTFRLQYPRASWLRRFKVFDRWLMKEVTLTGEGLDHFGPFLIDDVAGAINYGLLMAKLDEQITFAERIFRAVLGTGKITGLDVQKAIDMWGPRFQEVLKKYAPGELHNPLGLKSHSAEATYLGWESY